MTFFAMLRAVNSTNTSPRRPASLDGFLEISSMLCGMATLTGRLGKLWWLFELTSHFPLHLAAASGILTATWALKRRWPWMIFSAAVAALNVGLVLALFWPAPQPTGPPGARLRLAVVNVNNANTRADLVRDFLTKADVDVVLLMEINERWLNELVPLTRRYPEFIAEAREDNFGIALFHRVVTTNTEVVYWGTAEVPSIRTTLVLDGRQVMLLGTHPVPPGSAEYARLRNDQLQAIATGIGEWSTSTILLGDLNVTPWSPYFRDLLRTSGLYNTSQGRGLHGSWPANWPIGRIPIDHCLISPDIRVLAKRVGPHIGSDHRPVIVDLEITKP